MIFVKECIAICTEVPDTIIYPKILHLSDTYTLAKTIKQIDEIIKETEEIQKETGESSKELDIIQYTLITEYRKLMKMLIEKSEKC